MSGTLPTPCSSARTASSRYGTSSRLTMNPEVSFAAIGSLPSVPANANARRNVSSEVVTVRTTSTSCISGTGLKKCRPTKRSERLVAAAIAAIVRLDVLEAKIVPAPHNPSSSFHRAFLSSRSSVTASITMSHAFRSATAVVNVNRRNVASRSAAGSLPFSTRRARDLSIVPLPLSSTGWATSRTNVSYPAAAATCAMPLPIRPHPNTPTRWIPSMDLSELKFFADFFGDTHERAGARTGEAVFGPDLAAFEAVEDLFQTDLDALELLVAAGEQHGRGRHSESGGGRDGEGSQDADRRRDDRPDHP